MNTRSSSQLPGLPLESPPERGGGWRAAGRRCLPYLAATGSVAAATAFAFLLQRLPLANLAMVFLVGVIVVASKWGRGPSLVASVLSFLAFNFFFTFPYYTLRVDSRDDVATLFFFLAMAVLTGNLAARMRSEMARSRAALERVSTLYDFSRRMASAGTAEEVLQTLCERLSGALGCAAGVLLAEADGRLALHAASGGGCDSPELKTAAQHRWDGAPAAPPTPWQFLALETARGRAGLVALRGSELAAERHELATTLCDQAAAALERARLVGALEDARLESETERLRSALLSSVSHDLRTPLASIIGSSSSLLEYGGNFTEADRRELLTTVLEEARRLDRYIQNLLDMTRVGQGGISLRRDWVDLNDLVAGAIARLGAALDRVHLELAIGEEAAVVHVHGVFIEQVLINLLDNAARHTPPGRTVTVSARRKGEGVEIDVCDEGPGIPEAQREKVFEMFYSVRERGRGREGAGLGLAICRGLVGAHGGTIEVLGRPDGTGTCLRVTLPHAAPAEEDYGSFS